MDVHRKTIAYCGKTAADDIVREGEIEAKRAARKEWAESLGKDWVGGQEAGCGIRRKPSAIAGCVRRCMSRRAKKSASIFRRNATLNGGAC